MTTELPTFSVNDVTKNRILAAFSNRYDVNGAALTPVQAYKAWLRDQLTAEVLRAEADQSLKDQLV